VLRFQQRPSLNAFLIAALTRRRGAERPVREDRSLSRCTVYRRQVQYCTTCRRRLYTRATRSACAAADHVIETREQPIWWIKYQVGGRPVCVSSESIRKEDAKRLLRDREQAVDIGAPAATHAAKVTFDDAAADHRLRHEQAELPAHRQAPSTKHLTPYLQHRRLATINAIHVRAYTARRQAAGASNATINRELILLKRMCTMPIARIVVHHCGYLWTAIRAARRLLSALLQASVKRWPTS
jgi:hypothetical protein